MHILYILFLAFGCSSAAIYNYTAAVQRSIRFFEAQRTGKLPETNRIHWRGDSFLTDKGNNNEDLSGGYFDAGDFMKFGFPFASAMHFLAWGLVEFKDGYIRAGEFENALDALKWGTDWMIKAHVSPNELYAQVGLSDVDHSWWGRPEEVPPERPRPAFSLTTEGPGSDCAAEFASALSAASIVFRANGDDLYANELRRHARELYEFANNYRGIYSDVITDAADNYKSEGYGDELGLASAWLYRASGGDPYYKLEFERHWQEFSLFQRPVETYWEEKSAQLQVLMATLDPSGPYVNASTNWCNWIVDEAPRTPRGLVWLGNGWGSLAHSANAAFTCLILAKNGVNPTKYNDFAKSQIDYMLGDGIGRSFLIGFGVNSPQRPHHASSSCRNKPAPCDWDDYDRDAPNPQVLIGGLVGGPDRNDNYADNRDDYVGNEVTLDYNAGFQSVLAALVQNRS